MRRSSSGRSAMASGAWLAAIPRRCAGRVALRAVELARCGRQVENSVRISVCMATFNGERYLAEQVRSILSELGPDDELVVVEDCSTDSTPALLRSFGDPRIKVYGNDRNRGVNYSFGRAL